jgi:hypothetical protein
VKDKKARYAIAELARRVNHLQRVKADRTEGEMKKREGENHRLKVGNPFLRGYYDEDIAGILNPT